MTNCSHSYESIKNKDIMYMASGEVKMRKYVLLKMYITKALVTGIYKIMQKAWWKHCWIMYSLEKEDYDF